MSFEGLERMKQLGWLDILSFLNNEAPAAFVSQLWENENVEEAPWDRGFQSRVGCSEPRPTLSNAEASDHLLTPTPHPVIHVFQS